MLLQFYLLYLTTPLIYDSSIVSIGRFKYRIYRDAYPQSLIESFTNMHDIQVLSRKNEKFRLTYDTVCTNLLPLLLFCDTANS